MFNFDMTKVLTRRFYQYFAAITGSLGIISSEMHFGWPSPALPVLTNGSYFFQVSSAEASWLAVTIFPGIAFGAILSSLLADVIGRKKMILGTSVPLFASWMLLSIARNGSFMFLARFLGGVGGGLSFATVPMYLGEISEPAIRGLLSSLCPISVVLGILLINILGIYLTIEISALVACVVPLVMFCTFYYMPESPIWLLAKGYGEEAKDTLKILRGNEEGEREFIRLSKDLEDTMQDQPETDGHFLNLFRVPVNRKALMIAIGIRSIQQICGSTAITFYCKTIFLQNEGFISANSATILCFTLQVVLAIISSFVVDRVGRRPLFMFSLSGTTLTLFMTGAYMFIKSHFNWDLTNYQSVPMLSLLMNVSFFSMGIRNVPLLVISEIFHPKVKSLALCFVTIYYGVLAIAVTKFYQITNEMVEMACPFFTFGVLSMVSLSLYYYYVPETKGKTLEEIQKMLKNE